MAGPIARLVRGAVAGAAGALAMDLVWWSRYRRGGGDDGFADWEFATSTTSFEDASAPGKVGQRVARLVGVDLPDEAAGATTNVVHWLTGVGYGIGHALAHDGARRPAKTLAKDLSAHLVFGTTVGLVHAALSRTSRR